MPEQGSARESQSELKILVVSFFLPPSSKVGSKRFQFLARELIRRRHEVDLLGLRELGHLDGPKGCSPVPVHAVGWYPFLGVIGETRPMRFLRRLWARLLSPTDHYCGWVMPMVARGAWLARRQRSHTVIATGPPSSSFLAAYLIHKISGVPLMLDYRDPWTWKGGAASAAGERGIARRLENLIVGASSRIVVVTDYLKADFLAAFPGIDPDRVHVITNGLYPQGDLPERCLAAGVFNVVYAGKFYGERNAALLIDAISALKDEGLIQSGSFLFHVFGTLPPGDRTKARQRGVADLIREWGFRPYEEVLGYMRGADLLYLPSGSEFQYAVPFKFFDYLSVERPVLAIASPESQVAAMVQRTGIGEVADIGDPGEVVAVLRRMLVAGGRRTVRGHEEFLWETLACRYAELIREATAPLRAPKPGAAPERRIQGSVAASGGRGDERSSS